MKDREYAVPACLAAFDLATPGYKPNHDRAVFTMMPEKGTHKMTEVSTLHFSRWARPGGLYRLSNDPILRSEEHTSDLQSLMRISYAVFCLKKKTIKQQITTESDLYMIHTVSQVKLF